MLCLAMSTTKPTAPKSIQECLHSLELGIQQDSRHALVSVQLSFAKGLAETDNNGQEESIHNGSCDHKN